MDRHVNGFEPLPPGVAMDTALAEAGSPWLNEYVEFASRENPGSYPGYHEACGLWLLSTIAARRVSFHFGPQRYTSLYLALVGPAGFEVRRRAVEMALTTLQQAGLDWLRMPDVMQPDDVIARLVRRKPENYDQLSSEEQRIARLKFAFAGQRGLFYRTFNEVLRGVVDLDWDALSLPLKSLERCPYKYDRLRDDGELQHIDRVYLSILFDLTVDNFAPLLREGIHYWANGYLPRFSFVMPPATETIPHRRDAMVGTIPDKIIDPLRRWHETLGLPVVEMVNHPRFNRRKLRVTSPVPITSYMVQGDVREALYTYDRVLHELGKQWYQDTLLCAYLRLPERAMRVAVLLASLDGAEEIQLRHWARAQQIAETWRASIHRLVFAHEKIYHYEVRYALAY